MSDFYSYRVWFRTFVLDGKGIPVLIDGKYVVNQETDKGIVTVQLSLEEVMSPESALRHLVGNPPEGYSLNYELVP